MLTPEYLAECTNDITGLFDAFSTSVIQDMANRLVKYGKITETSGWQARQLIECGYLRDDIIRDLAVTTNYSQSYLTRLFNEAAIENIRYESDIAKMAGLEPIRLNQSPSMMQVLAATVEKTQGDLSNLTLTTAVKTQQAYMDAANLAYMQVVTGAMPYNQAIANAIKSAAARGLEIEYESGVVGKIDSAIRMSVLTAINQTAGRLTMMCCDAMGCDLVETTAHFGARPSHQEWQGQVFSLNGNSREYPNFEDSTGYGSGEGLCGFNCRHSFHAFFDGLSQRAYSQDRLDDMDNRTYEYNGKTYTDYQCSARQRAYERLIREDKRILSGLDSAIQNAPDSETENYLKDEFQAQSVKLKEHEAKMKDFCKATDREVDTSKTQVHAVKDNNGNIVSFNRSTSMKAVWANKRAANSRQGGG